MRVNRIFRGLGVGLQPALGLDYFERVRRGGQKLCQQWVRIQRDRLGQLVNLLLIELGVSDDRARCRRLRLILRCRRTIRIERIRRRTGVGCRRRVIAGRL